MTNTVNVDAAGNIFHNYITPSIFGEAGAPTVSTLKPMLDRWVSEGKGLYAGSSSVYMRFLNPLEKITSSLSSNTARLLLGQNGSWPGYYDTIYTYTGTSNTAISVTGLNQMTQTGTNSCFVVINNYAMCMTIMTPSRGFSDFLYVGYLREPAFTGNAYPRGVVYYRAGGANVRKRPLAENTTAAANLYPHTTQDAITSPPISCTPDTDPGDGSAVYTDIILRDADTPNNPVGKLWNCIDLPADSVVGGLYKNNGTFDGDNANSEQDIYLCVMPWGTRMLGMRVWTERV